MLVCSAPVMSTKRKATKYPEGIPGAKKTLWGCERELGNVDLNHNGEKLVSEMVGNRNPDKNIRRVASLNAQLALHFLLNDSPPSSPARSEGSLVPVHGESSLKYCISNHTPNHLQDCEDPSPDMYSATLNPATNGHFRAIPRSPSESSGDCPLSPPSDTKLEGRSSRLGSPKLMEPTVDLVDCKRKFPSLARRLAPPSPSPPPLTRVDSSGYVKRMASLNARACVAALIESERRYLKAKVPGSSKSKQKKEQSNSLSDQIPEEHVAPPKVTEVIAVVDHSTSTLVSGSGIESSEIGNEPCDVVAVSCESTVEDKAGDNDVAEASFNTLGLLYNGDTVHPHACIFLTNDWTVPERIIPVVVPAKPESLQSAMKLARDQHRHSRKKKVKAVKDDNGWTPLGRPIKIVEYRQGDTKVTRKYYIGIRRRSEEVFVRDCVVIKSGRKKLDKPYIAKVASLWQESGGIMMSVFWYYRPDDVEGINISDFQEREVLASQHHDDNSVACIEDKCYVVGFRQFCRYQAQAKRIAEHLERLALVPQQERLGSDVSLSRPPRDVESLLVFFCYRGYNHIAGRVLRKQVN